MIVPPLLVKTDCW